MNRALVREGSSVQTLVHNTFVRLYGAMKLFVILTAAAEYDGYLWYLKDKGLF